MSVGLGLLRKLIDDRLNISFLDNKRLPRRFFIHEERAVYDFVRDHCVQYGTCPILDTVLTETSIALPPSAEESIEYWVDKVKERNMVNLLTKIPMQIADLAGKTNVNDALKLYKKLGMELSYRGEGTKVKTLQECAPAVLKKFDRRQDSPTILGIPFGFPYLDYTTDGAQPGDSIAIAGMYGKGKSTMLFKFAHTANDLNLIPLIVTLEMPIHQCSSRFLSMQISVPNSRIRHGKLSYYGREKLKEGIDILDGGGKPPVYFMEGGMNTTVDDISLRIQELKPSALYVDGAYLLKTRNRSHKIWERVSETAELLKGIALDFNIPVMSTYQLNAQKEIGHSGMAIKQLASVVMILSDADDEADGTLPIYSPIQYKELELVKGREGETGKLLVKYDFARMSFTQESVIGGNRS